MKYMIVDDEPLARQRIKRLLASFAEFECIAQTGKPDEVMTLIVQHQPQLIFLDISMPEISGLELAKRINSLPAIPKIIFVTAHPQYALDAFGVFASGYLVKPIEQSELHQLLQHLFPPKIQYTLGNQTRWVEVREILVARADDKYTQLYFRAGQAIIETSLKQLSERYPEHFVQVHRNTLVKRSAMKALVNNDGGYFVSVEGFPEQIAVSRRAAKAIKSSN
ncbi:LytR/AlgR family response regulator transcription factor [Pseudoalteromonas sp. S16_S37]|uniref:LytR/AlgR family response regulator transcription factor n=1 Tax=Pseudoalteromonas sp. S16_S37 TaxID=2720228 RepID=UPI001680A251|nr:LytTR family DNA-binding domain-containing protein [Pseudoalteromonas sp. S16_S37]MBD1582524.1 response regulator transcription factor [Pseudoalteromonas sp. S16_S37]